VVKAGCTARSVGSVVLKSDCLQITFSGAVREDLPVGAHVLGDAGVKKLVCEDDLYRVRVGDYRIFYQIRDRDLLILVVKVGHRREGYS
jgi:mRNA-degrading endonuclease RelE of RelBE toxin-antitoxin system